MKCRKVVACILLVAMLLTLCACGKENSDGKKSSEEKETVSMLTAQKWKDVNSNSEMTFNENGTGTLAGDDFKWTLNGKSVTIDYAGWLSKIVSIKLKSMITEHDGYTVLSSEDGKNIYAK